MALLRVIHASSLPDPGELARRVASGEGPMPGNPASAPPPTSAVPPSPDASAGLPADFAGVISLLDADGQIALAEKIGRASCRERVCQYVSISVVADSFTHKKTTKHKKKNK